MPARRRPTRWLAPVAIVVVAATGYGVARSAMTKDEAPADRPDTARSPAKTTPEALPPVAQKPVERRYTVRAGDTLSAISLETGVSVARLQELNPDLDVQALQPGQRLKLRP